MIRRLVPAALVAGLVAALTACAGLPTSGDVNEGRQAERAAAGPEFQFIPSGPQPGASPEQIVDGFLRAGSGTADDWARAREFLAPAIRETWNPDAGVTVVTGDREYTSPEESVVSVSLVSVATVDERGTYEWADAAATALPFELAQQSDGEWRITSAPDGVVLDSDVFTRVYHRYAVMYFDPAWEYLVPDVRWFPTVNTATRIVDALVNKPASDWLADSVVTAFPEGVSAISAVPVSENVATVVLNEEAEFVDQTGLDRMQAQLEESLASAGIGDAEMYADTTQLVAEPVETRRTTVSGPPLVLIEEGFGFLSGDELTMIPGLSEAMTEVVPTAIQVAAERGSAAVLTTDGSVVRVDADASIVPVDTRDNLVEPAIDTRSAVWSVPRDRPQAMIAHSTDGSVRDIADAWPGATELHAFSISRDGTRVVAVVTAGTRSEVWVSGIVRGADGAAVRLGAPISLGVVSGSGIAVGWVDDTSVGVLSADAEGSVVREQLVTGPSSSTDAPADAASIAGATGISSVRLRGIDGALYLKRGSNWQETASGILVLATQQGTPR